VTESKNAGNLVLWLLAGLGAVAFGVAVAWPQVKKIGGKSA
jgi:hypothetical protein